MSHPVLYNYGVQTNNKIGEKPMPNHDFISDILGLEDVILKDVKKFDSQIILFIEKPRSERKVL